MLPPELVYKIIELAGLGHSWGKPGFARGTAEGGRPHKRPQRPTEFGAPWLLSFRTFTIE
jgi:hypothetical protein